MNPKFLPETGSRELRWELLRSPAPILDEADLAEIEADLTAMREAILVSTGVCYRGEAFDFQTKRHWADADLLRLGDSLAGRIENGAMGLYQAFNSWAFFGTNLPRRRATQKDTLDVHEWHADELDPKTVINMEYAPILLWRPLSSGTMGTQVVIPAGFERVREEIPSLVYSGFSQEGISEQIARGIEAGRFEIKTLEVARSHVLYPSCPVFTVGHL